MVLRQHAGEVRARGAEGDAVLRPPRPGDARLDGREIEGQRLVERRLRRVSAAPQALRAGVGLHQRALFGRAPGEAEIPQGFRVDGEEAAGRAVFRRHVGDGGAVGERQGVEPRAGEFDELAHHAAGAKHGGDGEHQVGRGGALGERALEADADDVRDPHGDRLAEHRRLGLDPAGAPAEDGEAVDHRGVAVGSDEGVGKGDVAAAGAGRGPHRARQVFQVDLVADAGSGRHDAEIVEGALAPAQKGVAFAIARHFDSHVFGERARRAEAIDLDRMVDDEIDRDLRVDSRRVLAPRGHGVAHGGEIDDRGDAGEVLHQHPRRAPGDFVRAAPRRERLDIRDPHRGAVLVAQQVLEHDLQREGQPIDALDPRLGRRGQAEIIVFAAADGQRAARVQRVLTGM